MTYEDGRYYLYDDEERLDAETFSAKIEAELGGATGPRFVTDGYDIGHDFPDRVGELCERLKITLGISIDFSEAERERIEREVNRSPRTFLEAGTFEALLAYCLEANRRVSGGQIVGEYYGDIFPCTVVHDFVQYSVKTLYEALTEDQKFWIL